MAQAARELSLKPARTRAAPAVLRPQRRAPDTAAAERAVGQLLSALGFDPGSANLMDTPARVARALSGMVTPKPFEMRTFPNTEGYDEMVVVRDISFHSLCEHHLLPFAGVAHVAYIPDEKVVGLSKLARVVDHFARTLQLQERLTVQIARFVDECLRPKGVGVVMEARHTCMSIRGPHKDGARTVTSAVLGVIRDDHRARDEFLRAVGLGNTR